jgi:hypothetical protein
VKRSENSLMVKLLVAKSRACIAKKRKGRSRRRAAAPTPCLISLGRRGGGRSLSATRGFLFSSLFLSASLSSFSRSSSLLFPSRPLLKTEMHPHQHVCGTQGCTRPDRHPGLCSVPLTLGKRRRTTAPDPLSHRRAPEVDYRGPFGEETSTRRTAYPSPPQRDDVPVSHSHFSSQVARTRWRLVRQEALRVVRAACKQTAGAANPRPRQVDVLLLMHLAVSKHVSQLTSIGDRSRAF